MGERICHVGEHPGYVIVSFHLHAVELQHVADRVQHLHVEILSDLSERGAAGRGGKQQGHIPASGINRAS